MSSLRIVGRGSRSCDGCTACCELLEVSELDKPEFKRCEHQEDTGCGNYDSRPPSCRDWDCLWLHGYMPDRYSPTKCGVMFTPQREGAAERLGFVVVGARELSRSASRMRHGEKAIKWLVGRGVSVSVQLEGGVRNFYPAKGVRPIIAAIYRKREIEHRWNGTYFISGG